MCEGVACTRQNMKTVAQVQLDVDLNGTKCPKPDEKNKGGSRNFRHVVVSIAVSVCLLRTNKGRRRSSPNLISSGQTALVQKQRKESIM